MYIDDELKTLKVASQYLITDNGNLDQDEFENSKVLLLQSGYDVLQYFDRDLNQIYGDGGALLNYYIVGVENLPETKVQFKLHEERNVKLSKQSYENTTSM